MVVSKKRLDNGPPPSLTGETQPTARGCPFDSARLWGLDNSSQVTSDTAAKAAAGKSSAACSKSRSTRSAMQDVAEASQSRPHLTTPGANQHCTPVKMTCLPSTLLSKDYFGVKLYQRVLVFVLNVFLTPVLLVGWSVSIYVYPCLVNLTGSCLCGLLFKIPGFKDWCTYTDFDFSANDANAGKTNCKWVRLQNVQTPGDSRAKTISHLFNKIEPSDIAQGALGDCWLLAALATLAERPELIEKCFVTRSFNPRGKYQLRLLDQKAAKPRWTNVTVDDLIPCDESKSPLFCKPKGNEMWPLLIEKAFAKMRGGYHAIEGGWSLDAMQTITGFKGECFDIKSNSSNDLFFKLKKMHDAGCIMACGSKGEDKTRELGRDSVQGSIVGGHAYSILGMYAPTLTTEKVLLLKLRNPWGTFEWKGDWGDKSPLWQTHPGVGLTIGRPKDVDDGIFYIAWHDFARHYSNVDVLYPDTSLADLHLTVHEEAGVVLGPVVGCVAGCASFWCLCGGPYALLCAQTSAEKQAELAMNRA